MLAKSHVILVLCIHGLVESATHYVKNHQVFEAAEFKMQESPFLTDAKSGANFSNSTEGLKSRVHSRPKRDTRTVEFEIEGTTTLLNLVPLEYNVIPDDLKVWVAVGHRIRPPYYYFYEPNQEQTRIEGTFYKDSKNMAIMFAYYKYERGPSIHYDGVFGESSEIVARSLQEKWSDGSRAEMSDYTINEPVENVNDFMLSNDHVENEKLLDEPLKTLYPKLLLVVESNYFKLFDKDVTEVVKYLSIFWNAVNLRYSKLSRPRVRIVITGILIEHDEYALRYIYESRKKGNLALLDTQVLLDKAGKYFNGKDFARDTRDFNNFDATITITNFETGTVKGRAYVGTICSETNNAAYVNDDGNFDGVPAAVHELGHLLNLPHDGEKDAHYCKSAYYRKNVGTIMARRRESADKYIWSKCSKRILEKFSWRKAAECLRYPKRKDIAKH